jgi:single-stranded-DNA-specific exonuclease
MEHLLDLEEALIRALAVSVRGEVAALQLVDRHLSLDEVTWKNFQTIARLAPFGEGNPKPLFLFEQVRLASVRLFGRDKNHLELTFQNSAGQPVIAIGFFMHALAEKLSLEAGKSLDLVASFERSTFKATPELRLRIAHIV